jgi:hypothetical protein
MRLNMWRVEGGDATQLEFVVEGRALEGEKLGV